MLADFNSDENLTDDFLSEDDEEQTLLMFHAPDDLLYDTEVSLNSNIDNSFNSDETEENLFIVENLSSPEENVDTEMTLEQH